MRRFKKVISVILAFVFVMVGNITFDCYAEEKSEEDIIKALYEETGGNEYNSENVDYWKNVKWDINDINRLIEQKDCKTMARIMRLSEGDDSGDTRGGVIGGGTWMYDSNGWWYKLPDGSYPYGGWYQIDGKWYYFLNSGYIVIGWVNDGGTWYYTDVNGAMVTGWIIVSGKQYYMGPTGAMQTGWVNPSGTWYYCDESTGEWIDNWGTKLVQSALQYQGVPYVWGGTSLSTGVDCSGFTQAIHSLRGYSIPRVAQDQYNGRVSTQSWSSLKPGDLIFFGSSTSNISHVGMYVGKINGSNNQMIHASSSYGYVVVSNLNSNVVAYGSYWR